MRLLIGIAFAVALSSSASAYEVNGSGTSQRSFGGLDTWKAQEIVEVSWVNYSSGTSGGYTTTPTGTPVQNRYIDHDGNPNTPAVLIGVEVYIDDIMNEYNAASNTATYYTYKVRWSQKQPDGTWGAWSSFEQVSMTPN